MKSTASLVILLSLGLAVCPPTSFAADRDAMLYYVAFFDMHAEVQWLMRDEDAEVASKARTDDPAAWAKSEHEDETSDNWGDRPTVADDLLSLPPIVVDVSPRRESLFSGLFTPGGFVFSYGASAVLLLIALLIGWSLKISHDNRAEHTASGPRPSASPIQANAAPAIVGRITDMVDCRWSNSKTEAIRREVALGQGFSLSTGLLEITYDTGAKVILQGPCAYRINSACGGFLALGRLTARVEKKAAIKEGSGNIHHSSSIKRHSPNPLFAVQTPTATVTDLGTEFGVEVSAEGRTDARVFEGAIRVATEAGKGDRRQDRICRQGEAVRVVPGKSAIRVIGEKEASGAGYSRAMPARASAVECRSYAQMVLSLRPVIYYRMERPVGRVDPRLALDSAPGAHHGQLHVASDIFGGSPYRMGRFGDSLDWEIRCEMDESMSLTPLLLEPLVENAVKHGVREKTGGGRVTVAIGLDGGEIHFRVADDGVGMSAERLREVLADGAEGIGLRNIRRRLQLEYRRTLHISSRPGEGTTVWFSLPLPEGARPGNYTGGGSPHDPSPAG